MNISKFLTPDLFFIENFREIMLNATQLILEKLTPVFRSVFDDDELVIKEFTTAQDIEGWDSLAHIRLMLSIEKALGIRFSAAEISGFKDIGAMLDLILKKQAAV